MKRVGKNEACPCGSGKKHKKCCWGKDFQWLRDSLGGLHQKVQGEAEVICRTQRFMEKADIDPAFIYAFEKTGRSVTVDKRDLLSDEEIKEWEDAINEYRRRTGKD